MNECAECNRKYTCERSFFRRRTEGNRNDEPMKKLVKILDNVLQRGLTKKYNLTPYEFNELVRYHGVLMEYRPVIVLDEKLKDLLVKCGFTASEEGVGWIIS